MVLVRSSTYLPEYEAILDQNSLYPAAFLLAGILLLTVPNSQYGHTRLVAFAPNGWPAFLTPRSSQIVDVCFLSTVGSWARAVPALAYILADFFCRQ